MLNGRTTFCALLLMTSLVAISLATGARTAIAKASPSPTATSGSSADIAAVTSALLARMRPWAPSPAVKAIYFAPNYALAVWTSGEQGGVAVYKDVSGTWTFVFGGGGAVVPSTLTSHGVPSAIAKQLYKEAS